jgi:cell division protein ZipA
MAELRWILLAAGVLLVAGLWAWEVHRTRRARRAAAEAATPPRTEPSIAGIEPVAAAPSDLPAIRTSPSERIATPLKPPVVEIPHDAEPELMELPIEEPARVEARRTDQPASVPQVDDDDEGGARPSWVRTQPLDRARLAEARQSAGTSDAAHDQSAAAAEQPKQRQRIVALRVLTKGDRWPGRALVDALEAEGLVYGKYSIYHRQRSDGKTIFFAASLVEPGSFDLEKLDELTFPGVSLFAVLPGPMDAPSTFDQMLASARRLAEKLDAQLQDEQGSTLTAQRILNVREELVHFEHVNNRLRTR